MRALFHSRSSDKRSQKRMDVSAATPGLLSALPFSRMAGAGPWDEAGTAGRRAGSVLVWVGGQLIVRVINCVWGRHRSLCRPRLPHLLVLSCLASQRWSKVIPQGRIERKAPEQELTRSGTDALHLDPGDCRQLSAASHPALPLSSLSTVFIFTAAAAAAAAASSPSFSCGVADMRCS
ncbi:hypothetical protein NQZ68_009296 [Dissostichus eleginoides]|nr:hypothetical protein NQZ68_009296 [Dissostichus eleginoides]